MHSTAQAAISSRDGSARTGSPAEASPAANVSKGRMRLPPPSTAYRMASCRRCGAIPADGRKRSSAVSTRAWTFAIQAVNSCVVVGTGEVFQGVFFKHLHLLLRAREDPLAVLSQLEASLVRGKGLLQSQLSRLHAGHDLLQFGQGGLEALGLICF